MAFVVAHCVRFLPIEGPLQKVHRGFRIVEGQVRGNGVISIGNMFGRHVQSSSTLEIVHIFAPDKMLPQGAERRLVKS
jgi:hypothetical protein